MSLICYKQHQDALGAVLSETVGTSGLGLCDVITVQSDAPALTALDLIVKHKLSGVRAIIHENGPHSLTPTQIGIVDSDGVMVTTVSCSDLRVVTTGKRFRLVGISSLQLVQKSRALEANARPAIVCVRITTHLTDIIKRLAATGLHRVYILDDDEKPIGVISLYVLSCQLGSLTYSLTHSLTHSLTLAHPGAT